MHRTVRKQSNRSGEEIKEKAQHDGNDTIINNTLIKISLNN